MGIGKGCFLYHKVTKLKANHNYSWYCLFLYLCCFLYHKVTKLKANHNKINPHPASFRLFPISQSY